MAYDEILDGAYLKRAPADAVYSWLKDSHVDYDSRSVFFTGVAEEIESALLARNDETIDLGLARWATNPETVSSLFARWCTYPAWPPRPDSFSYPVICAILSNASMHLPLLAEDSGPCGISREAFDWIVEHGDKELVHRMHSNDCVGLALIRKCCRREEIYAAIPDERWFQTLLALCSSKRFKRPPREYDDSPDMFHWDVHRGIVDAVLAAPKTLAASNVLWSVLNSIPPAIAKDAYIDDKALLSVVESWAIDIEDVGSFSHHKSDSLTPGERVQFHLLRLYGSAVALNPDDESRAYRLAAYSKCYLSNTKRSKTEEFKRLKVEEFQKYSDRDGPAFVFAASFNGNIWGNDAAALAMSQGNFPPPQDTEYLYCNRPGVAREDATIGESDWQPDPGAETRPGVTMPEVQSLFARLSEQVKSLKAWVAWVALAVVVVLKW